MGKKDKEKEQYLLAIGLKRGVFLNGLATLTANRVRGLGGATGALDKAMSFTMAGRGYK